MSRDTCVLIDAYLDDELGSAQRLRVEEHVRSCGSCRQALSSGLQLRQLVTGAGWVHRSVAMEETWGCIEPHLAPRTAGLGTVGWIVGGAMLITALFAYAALLQLFGLWTAERLGLPIDSWMGSFQSVGESAARFGNLDALVSGDGLAAEARDLALGFGRGAAELVRLLPGYDSPGWSLPFEPGSLAPALDAFVLSAVGFSTWLLLTCLALSFFGWTLAARRRRPRAALA